MNIVVLAGGLSPERNVSLASGGQIANALTAKGHKVVLVDPYVGIDKARAVITQQRVHELESRAPEATSDAFDALYEQHRQVDYSRGIPVDEPDLVAIQREHGDGKALIGPNVVECCRLADVVVLGLHGSIGENGQLQAMFDLFGITYTGSGYAASLLAMDKLLSKRLVSFAGIPTAPYEAMSIAGLSEDELLAALGDRPLPYVVKPRNGGSSIGVTVVRSPQDAARALRYASSYEDEILIEQYVFGREFSVGVLGDKALPVVEIIAHAEFFDYTAKYQGNSEEICPAEIPADLEHTLQDLALRAHQTLGLESYSRSDFIVDAQGDVYWLEINSLPGLTAASLIPEEARAAGIDYNDFCETLVNLALAKKPRR